MKTYRITVQEFKEYFNLNYSHISHELTDKQIYQELKRYNFRGLSIAKSADLFSDYILSSGLADVQE